MTHADLTTFHAAAEASDGADNSSLRLTYAPGARANPIAAVAFALVPLRREAIKTRKLLDFLGWCMDAAAHQPRRAKNLAFFRVALGLLALAGSACGHGWVYENAPDTETGKQATFSTVTSVNSLSLKEPYAGENQGHLRIVDTAGLRVELWIDKGRLMCHSYLCVIKVRFDDAEPITFSGARPPSRAANVVILDREVTFVRHAMKASRIRVQFDVYDQAKQTLEFDAKSLSWPR